MQTVNIVFFIIHRSASTLLVSSRFRDRTVAEEITGVSPSHWIMLMPGSRRIRDQFGLVSEQTVCL